MEPDKINSDLLMKELGGCGRFQVTFSFLVYLVYAPWAFSYVFMAFGAYNPGWRCLDNVTSTTFNFTQSTITTSVKDPLTLDDQVESNGEMSDYQVDTCLGYDTCQHIDFNPEASTIVTEFGLICDKQWLVSLIMTIQMVGSLVGALLVGYLGDKFGRRTTLYSFLLLNAVSHLICMFSVSVQMFIVLRFFIGICGAVMGYIALTFITEFVLPKWRVVIASVPAWAIGNIVFAISAMLMKDWKHMHLLVTCFSLACTCSVFWVPESLRWLAVNGKEKKYLAASHKIARLNKASLNREHCIKLIHQEAAKKSKVKEYGILNLFRKGYRRYPFCLGLPYFMIDMFYVVTALGASTLPGNLYVNLIILSVTELPSCIICAIMPNILGRRLSTSGGLIFVALCTFGVVALELCATGKTREIGVVVLVVFAKVGNSIGWFVLSVYTIELYPTVIRSTASGYGGLMGVLGSIVAPYLIPNDPATFYISYVIVAVIALICAGLLLLLPETKGKPLPDNWVTKDGSNKRLEVSSLDLKESGL